MKTKITIFLIGIIICCLMSCSRNNSAMHSNNYWTLAGSTFNVTNCTAPAENIEASNYSGNLSNYSSLTFNFSQNVASAGNRTYRTVDNSHYTFGTTDNVVVISASSNIGSSNGASYTTTNNATGIVTVTISNTGIVTAVGTGISMKNDNVPSDLETIDFNLIQTH